MEPEFKVVLVETMDVIRTSTSKPTEPVLPDDEW